MSCNEIPDIWIVVVRRFSRVQSIPSCLPWSLGSQCYVTHVMDRGSNRWKKLSFLNKEPDEQTRKHTGMELVRLQTSRFKLIMHKKTKQKKTTTPKQKETLSLHLVDIFSHHLSAYTLFQDNMFCWFLYSVYLYVSYLYLEPKLWREIYNESYYFYALY